VLVESVRKLVEASRVIIDAVRMLNELMSAFKGRKDA